MRLRATKYKLTQYNNCHVLEFEGVTGTGEAYAYRKIFNPYEVMDSRIPLLEMCYRALIAERIMLPDGAPPPDFENRSHIRFEHNL